MNAKGLINFYDTYLSDTIQTGEPHGEPRRALRLSAVPKPPLRGSPNPGFPELLPAVQLRRGFRLPAHLALGPAPSRRHLRDRAGSPDAAASVLCPVRRPVGLRGLSVNAFPGIAALDYYWTDANENGRVEPPEIDLSEAALLGRTSIPTTPGLSAPVNQIAANLEPPETDEFIVGIERQVSSDLSVSLAYTYRRLPGPLFSPLIGTTRASYRYDGNATGTAAIRRRDSFSISASPTMA